MRPRWNHRWDLTPVQARRLQEQARRRIILVDDAAVLVLPTLVAAADVGYDRATDRCAAALVLWDTGRGQATWTATAVAASTFPYVPGLLSFREIPPLLPLLDRLPRRPGLILCDGQGIAHPRRMGLASHLGLMLDCPSLGWAKSRLIGEYEEPGLEAGSASALTDGGEQIGWVLRSRARCQPTFISPGHRISMNGALRLALSLMGPCRLSQPARLAHRLTREAMARGR